MALFIVAEPRARHIIWCYAKGTWISAIFWSVIRIGRSWWSWGSIKALSVSEPILKYSVVSSIVSSIVSSVNFLVSTRSSPFSWWGLRAERTRVQAGYFGLVRIWWPWKALRTRWVVTAAHLPLVSIIICFIRPAAWVWYPIRMRIHQPRWGESVQVIVKGSNSGIELNRCSKKLPDLLRLWMFY